MKKIRIRSLSPVALISLGFFIIIFIGTILLLMPFSSVTHNTSFLDAFFTSTSATCVTGLTTVNTSTHWSIIGQIIILVLIQIGGLGFMTIITLFSLLIKKNLSLYNQTVLMQSAGSYSISDVGKIVKRVFIGTFTFEGIGALILSICLWPKYGTKSIFYGIFHSVSSFCNAGFDIFGNSLTDYSNNWIVMSTISILIIVGGLGFIVWSDVIDCKFRFKNLQLHSKIVLLSTLFLIFVPALLFFIFEFTNIGQSQSFEGYSLSSSILNSIFLSISPRTAGFNSVNIANLSGSAKLLTIILMFIGGNSGSTAGGLKVTTFIVVFRNLISSAKGEQDVVLFKRKIPTSIIKQSTSLLIAYLTCSVIATLIICSLEGLSLESVLFEVVSAIGTVGLSLGLTPTLGVISKLILIFLMYIGRIGALTLFSLFFKRHNDLILKNPEGKILVG